VVVVLEAEGLVEADLEVEVFVVVRQHSEWVVQDPPEHHLEELGQPE